MNELKLVLLITIYLASDICAWSPPIGIPEPDFGIKETNMMYKGKIFAFSTGAKVYPDAGNGPYTHYIDNQHPNATDRDNPYGSVDKPRMTIPKVINEPGVVVEIHGGPYTINYSIWKMYGTKQNPIFIRGVSKESMALIQNSTLHISGSYIIIEFLELSNVITRVRTFNGESETHHVSIRHCESHSIDETAFQPTSDDTLKVTNNIVFYDNYIHSDLFDPQNPPPGEDDDVGIYLGKRSSYIWILDNEICTFKGDAVGGAHGANYTAKNYFIGRNNLHTCFENALDFKEAENIVVSQNKLHDISGLAVVHYGPKFSPKNVWFIANEFYNATDCGIQVGGDQRHDVYIIGNIFHDIHNDSNTAMGYRTWNCEGVYLIHNVFYNVDNPIVSNVNSNRGFFVLQNCIFSNISDKGYFLTVSGADHIKRSEISHNIFYQKTGNVRFMWSGKECSLADIKRLSGKGDSCIIGDPKFVDPNNNNFALKNSDIEVSPGIDAGKTTAFDSLYYELFGITLSKDFEGMPRPADGNADGIVKYDIGCYEHSGLKNNARPPNGVMVR